MVGIGGGRTLDVAKYAASLSGLPVVAVATSLAHDGIASPVASLEDDEAGRKASYGVQMPIAVVVDLDYVRRSEPAMRRSGIGDAISNLSAIADWRLAERERGEAVDGVAVTFARVAATSIVHREDGIEDDAFLIALAEALVLSGLAMATAGSSRPCSGGDHEILHAIDVLFPGTANHGELAGAASLFTSYLRGDDGLTRGHRRVPAPARPAAHAGRPRADATSSSSEAVVRAPDTRPDRFTILEHLALDEAGVRRAVAGFAAMPTIAELRAATQPASIFERNSGEHWAGRLYIRRASPYLTRRCCRTRDHAERRDLADDPGRARGRRRAGAARRPARGRRLPADPAPDPARLLRRRAGALARREVGARRLPGPDRPLADRGGAPDRDRRARRGAGAWGSWRRCWCC